MFFFYFYHFHAIRPRNLCFLLSESLSSFVPGSPNFFRCCTNLQLNWRTHIDCWSWFSEETHTIFSLWANVHTNIHDTDTHDNQTDESMNNHFLLLFFFYDNRLFMEIFLGGVRFDVKFTWWISWLMFASFIYQEYDSIKWQNFSVVQPVTLPHYYRS